MSDWSQPPGPVIGYQQSNDTLQPSGLVSLYELGSANGYPIYRSGSGPFNIGFQGFLSVDDPSGLSEFVWRYQLLNNGDILASWREDNATGFPVLNPSLVATWFDEEIGFYDPVEGVPVFTPIYGPIPSPGASSAAASGNLAPTTPGGATAAAGGNLSPSAPVGIV